MTSAQGNAGNSVFKEKRQQPNISVKVRHTLRQINTFPAARGETLSNFSIRKRPQILLSS